MSAIAQRLSQTAARHEKGDLQEAERLCRQVIQREPMQVEALNLLGVICRQTGRMNRAADYLRKAVQEKPGDAAAHHNVAEVLRESGDLDGAIMEYRAVTDLRPAIAAVWSNLGAALRNAGRPGEAVEALAFCQLPWHEQCLAFPKNRRIAHVAGAGQVRRLARRPRRPEVSRASPFAPRRCEHSRTTGDRSI